MTGLRRYLAPVLGLALVGAGWASSAAAQEEAAAERLVLRAVDSRDDEAVEVVVSYSGDGSALGDLVLEENGNDMGAEVTSAAAAGFVNDVTFLVDTSTTTDANAMLTTVEGLLADYVADLPEGMRVSIVAAGAAAQVLQPHTTDVGELNEAITDLTPGGEGGVLAGVLQAAGRLDGEGTVGTVVLFTDGAPNESASPTVAEGGLEDAGAMLHVIGLNVDGFDPGLFRGLTDATGGSIRTVEEAGDLDTQFAALTPELANLAVATYESPNSRGVHDLHVLVGEARSIGSYVAGGYQLGVERLIPRPGVEPSGPGFLRGELGKNLGLLGVAVAALLFAFGMISVFVRDDTALTTALRPYSDSYVAEGEDGQEEVSSQPALLKRAVAATESFADRQGFLTRVEKLLEKADLPLRAGEAMFFYMAGVFLLMGLAFAFTQNVVGALVIALLGIIVPPAVLNFLANRKRKQFESLLPDTLQLLSSTLRAGYSMMQGVEAVSQEAAEPMGKELRRVVTEARLGRPLEESLDAVAERMDSADFGWAVMAIRIQREVGGNLAELLMTVSETMVERERLRRDVNSLTAEGRISAYVLIGLPVSLGFFLYTLNPDYIGKLFDETLGQILMGLAILGIGVGYAWMMKIIKIEI